MRIPVCIAVLISLHSAAIGQGAIIEKLDDFLGAPAPPGFRGELPSRVDLSAKLPAPRSQGSTMTCTSWAVSYAAATLASRARGLSPALALSPAFTYNQVSRDQWCGTDTRIPTTLDMLRDTGSLPIDEFTYDGAWCGRMPTALELERAKAFRIRGWSVFDATSIDKVKEQLTRGVPVIFATLVTAKMMSLRGDDVLQDDDLPRVGHSMVAVGYDDAKKAFMIQNSWGRSWASGGYGWFGYDFWRRNVSIGFVIE